MLLEPLSAVFNRTPHVDRRTKRKLFSCCVVAKLTDLRGSRWSWLCLDRTETTPPVPLSYIQPAISRRALFCIRKQKVVHTYVNCPRLTESLNPICSLTAMALTIDFIVVRPTPRISTICPFKEIERNVGFAIACKRRAARMPATARRVPWGEKMNNCANRRRSDSTARPRPLPSTCSSVTGESTPRGRRTLKFLGNCHVRRAAIASFLSRLLYRKPKLRMRRYISRRPVGVEHSLTVAPPLPSETPKQYCNAHLLKDGNSPCCSFLAGE